MKLTMHHATVAPCVRRWGPRSCGRSSAAAGQVPSWPRTSIRSLRSRALTFSRTPKHENSLHIVAAVQEPDFKIKLNHSAAVATIAGAATAVPPHLLTREMVKERIGDVFSLEGKRLEAIRAVIDNSQIDQRYSVFPADYIIEPRPLAQINAEYREKAVELGSQVTAQALAQAGMIPTDIDLLITVSCTGIMIPSFDAYIATGVRPRRSRGRLRLGRSGHRPRGHLPRHGDPAPETR